MFCLACGRSAVNLCPDCRRSLTPAPDRVAGDGLLVRSAWRHEGAARDLVHHFKYRGSDRAGWVLASALAPLVPEGVTIVPLPRPFWRTLRYGIDPAPDLARRLRVLTGCSIAPILHPPLFSPRQAGRRRSERIPPPARVGSHPGAEEVFLLDDVITTGSTLAGAQAALESCGVRVRCALTATARGD